MKCVFQRALVYKKFLEKERLGLMRNYAKGLSWKIMVHRGAYMVGS
jgi:hypothetical protein